jgi:hypothetical protein
MTLVDGSTSPRCASSLAMPAFRLGDGLYEFADIACADQLTLAAVAAWRHRSVIPGGLTARQIRLRGYRA